jgi:hypothetical protein
MNTTSQAVIEIRRPMDWVVRSFIVQIDGRRVGKVKRRRTGEFTVEPGEHTVVVSLDW